MKNYIDTNDSLYDITEKFPETIQVFANNGITKLNDESIRKNLGKTINLKQFSEVKGKDINLLVELLEQSIKNSGNYKDLVSDKNSISIKGLIPCPVRLPLQEKLEKQISESTYPVTTDLRAASAGTKWLEDDINKAEDTKDLPDIFISAGFELFFDKKMFGKFIDNHVYQDITGITQYNNLFKNIDLKDPQNRFSIIGVVPAVFLINMNELGNVPLPTKWSDLFQPEFENKVSLPVGDFDLFNALLIHIYKMYGETGITGLKKSLLKSLHPSEMIKSEYKKTEKPIVTIMPYFFTKMVKKSSSMKCIWPEDGAIISPIFMLTKKESADKIKDFVELFISKEIGEILSHNGRFPSTNIEVDNRIGSDKKFIWLGWDYIEKNNITDIIKKCTDIFESQE